MKDISKARLAQRVMGEVPQGGVAPELQPCRPGRAKETEKSLAAMSKPLDSFRAAGLDVVSARKANRGSGATGEFLGVSQGLATSVEVEAGVGSDSGTSGTPENTELFQGLFPPVVRRGRGRPPKPVDPSIPIKPKRKPGRPRKDEQLVPATLEAARFDPDEHQPNVNEQSLSDDLLQELVAGEEPADISADKLDSPAAPIAETEVVPRKVERVSWVGSDEDTNYLHPFTLSYSEDECRVNGVLFRKEPGVLYKHDYPELARRVVAGELSERDAWRPLLQNDLWAICYFVLKVAPLANHSFIVNYAKEIEEGPQSETLDLVAREHFKSTLITISETIKDILCDPEERICILSYAATSALSFLRAIKYTFESSDFLKKLFPDIFWKNPDKDSSRWSEVGFIVRRKGNYKESTVEAYGLAQGMPTGGHYSKLVYDDIMVADMAFSPIAMERCKEKFGLSANLGTMDGRSRVIGTFYHFNDPLVYISKMKDDDGNPLYFQRKKPATVGGEFWGEPVFLPKKRLVKLRADKYSFNTQQLLNPNPVGQRKLDSANIIEIDEKDIPKNLVKLMMVDPAGTSEKAVASRDPDSWAAGVLGVSQSLEIEGGWDVYLLDLFVEACSLSVALEQIVHMYVRNGYIKKLGVEKVGQSTFEIHVANALKARGRIVSLDKGNMEILSPAGRSKEYRIESALEPVLNKRRFFMSRKIAVGYRDRLREELDQFPMWHDDALDVISYGYDLMRKINFQSAHVNQPSEKAYARPREYGRGRRKRIGTWMTAG